MLYANIALCSTQQCSERKSSTETSLLGKSTRWLKKVRIWIPLLPDQQPLHEHQLPSNVYATLFPLATKSVQRHRRKKKIILLDIPYENFIGSILGGRFQLQRLRSQEDHLDTYAVTNRCGQSFEAQAFSLSDSLPEKLLQARKRRMKRILLSRSFVCEIQQAGKRFLVSDVRRSDAEWKNLCQRSERQVYGLTRSKDFLTEEAFPGLAPSSCRKGSVSSDSASQVDGNSVCSSRPASSLTSRSSYSSYAQVAAKGLEYDRCSKTPKGVKQRQRRQRKREVRETSSALPNRITSKNSLAQSTSVPNRHDVARRVSRRDQFG
ncbi:hypothetical protein V8E51_014599 [Hyaloscypha variabilis]